MSFCIFSKGNNTFSRYHITKYVIDYPNGDYPIEYISNGSSKCLKSNSNSIYNGSDIACDGYHFFIATKTSQCLIILNNSSKWFTTTKFGYPEVYIWFDLKGLEYKKLEYYAYNSNETSENGNGIAVGISPSGEWDINIKREDYIDKDSKRVSFYKSTVSQTVTKEMGNETKIILKMRAEGQFITEYIEETQRNLIFRSIKDTVSFLSLVIFLCTFFYGTVFTRIYFKNWDAHFNTEIRDTILQLVDNSNLNKQPNSNTTCTNLQQQPPNP